MSQFCTKHWILTFFRLPPLKGTKNHRLYSWLIGTPALLQRKPMLESVAMFLPEMVELQSEAQNGRFLTSCDTRGRHAHTRKYRLKNDHTWFSDCSYMYYSFEVTCVWDWKQKFNHCTRLTLFSNPITFCCEIFWYFYWDLFKKDTPNFRAISNIFLSTSP